MLNENKRTIEQLEQDVVALKKELHLEKTRRKRLTEALRLTHAEVNRRVDIRTTQITETNLLELRQTNEQLAQEIQERQRIEAQLQQQTKQLSSLYMLGQITSNPQQSERLLSLIVRGAAGLVEAEASALLLLDMQTDTLQVQATYGVSQSVVEAIYHWGDDYLAHTVRRKHSAVMVEDIATISAPHQQIAEQSQLRASISVPLLVGGKFIGALDIYSGHPTRTFSDHDNRWLSMLAHQVAMNIENNRLFHRQKRQHQISESLRQVALILTRSLDRDEVLQELLIQLGRVIEYDGTGIFLHEGDDLVLLGGQFHSQSYIGKRIAVDSYDPTARTFRQKKPLILADVLSDPHWSVWHQDDQIRAWMGVPLLIGDTAIGVMTIDHFTIGAYNQTDTQLLQLFASQAAIAIRNARLYTQAQADRTAAEVANEAKSRFLATISHEFRTPLNAILGYLQLMQRDDSLPIRYHETLSIIEQSSQHLLLLISDILDMSKIEADKMVLETSRFYFPDFVQTIIQIMRVRAEEKELTLQMQFFDFMTQQPLDHLLYWVEGDTQRLRQVLINLLSNGIKYTESGHVKLTIGPIKQEQDDTKTWLRFQVDDTGIGIDPAHFDTIFQPFTRASAHIMQGTGLGLSISKRLVELMGGNIFVKSEVAQGSSFWFDIPLLITVDRSTIRDKRPLKSQPFTLSTIKTSLELPPEDLLMTFYDLAMLGDIAALEESVLLLTEKNPEWHPFCHEICRLSQTFQIKKIQELLKQYLPTGGP